MRAWVIALVLVLSSTAFADGGVPAPDPAGAMEDYFGGEITGGWVLMGMGAAGLTAGGILIADGGDRAAGASYVAFGFGAAHLVAGVYVNIASRIRRRVYGIAIASEHRKTGANKVFVAAESRRMNGVSTQFLVLKIVEVALIAGGGTMAYLGNTSDRPRLEGAGYALAAEAAATLLFDIVAARRAHRYRARLGESSIDLHVTADVSGQPVVLVGPMLRF